MVLRVLLLFLINVGNVWTSNRLPLPRHRNHSKDIKSIGLINKHNESTAVYSQTAVDSFLYCVEISVNVI